MAHENKLVAEFQKSDIEIVRVSLTQYKNKDYFDIRLYYQEDRQWKPTKKGLCLSLGLFPKFKRAVLALEKTLGEHNRGQLRSKN